MSVLKRWKYGKRSSQCSSGNNNNNVNAFLTCTAQEALFGSYNSSVNLFSPFSALSVVSRTVPVSPFTVSFWSVSPLPICTRCSMQGEKARSFSTRGGYANTSRMRERDVEMKRTRKRMASREQRRMRCRFYASPSHSYLLRHKQKYGTRAYPLFREHAVIIVAEYRALTSNAPNAFNEGLQRAALLLVSVMHSLWSHLYAVDGHVRVSRRRTNARNVHRTCSNGYHEKRWYMYMRYLWSYRDIRHFSYGIGRNIFDATNLWWHQMQMYNETVR